MKNPKTLKSQFDNLDGQRANMLSRARECAALTLPDVLPPLGLAKDDEILRPYQSLGAYGSTNLVNKLLLTMYPVGVSLMRFAASAKIRGDANTTQESLAALEAILYWRELLVRDKLESSRIRVRKRTCLEQIVVVGNTLSTLTDDYTLKVFRLDNYVQKRDSDGTWRYVIVHEQVDPIQLSETQLAAAGITPEEIESRDFSTNPLHLYTKCERQRNGTFVIQQELNGKIVAESEEPVTPYFPSGYVELPNENYSRGFIEERLGALRSLNGHHYAMYAASAACSKILWGIDTDLTNVTPADLAKATGSVVAGVRIREGKWDGVGCLQAEKLQDMQVSFQVAGRLSNDLSTQMLIESAVQPQGERVTAYQVNRIARELEGATGGIYVHVAEEEQRPLVERVVYQMKRDNLLPALPKAIDDEIQIEIITGVEAMSRQRDAEKVQALFQLLQVMPQYVNYYEPEWINNTVVRGLGIDERAALKSKEKLEMEQAQAAEMQAKMALAQQAIQSGGKVIENASKPQAARPAA